MSIDDCVAQREHRLRTSFLAHSGAMVDSQRRFSTGSSSPASLASAPAGGLASSRLSPGRYLDGESLSTSAGSHGSSAIGGAATAGALPSGAGSALPQSSSSQNFILFKYVRVGELLIQGSFKGTHAFQDVIGITVKIHDLKYQTKKVTMAALLKQVKKDVIMDILSQVWGEACVHPVMASAEQFVTMGCLGSPGGSKPQEHWENHHSTT